MYAIIGAMILVFNYLFNAFLISFANDVALKTKQRYLKKILMQDCKYYDTTNYLELPSKISKETNELKEAIGQKSGQLTYTAFMAVGSLAFGLA
jgi:hypothetical protein